ncbi:MAG: DUF6206 family protein [Candidatus Odinarchaeota archaeon]
MEINTERLAELEQTIDTLHPEKGAVPIKILGFGEISLVFELIEEGKVAYKRLPIFDSEKQVKRHELAYNVYQRILKEKIGLRIPPQASAWFKTPRGSITLYCAQEKILPESVGNKVIHQASKQEVQLLVLLVMRELKKVWDFNIQNSKLKVGIDGQISNWSLIGYDPNNPSVKEDGKLLYLDTSTPMYRKNGIEAMEAVLFLKSAPSFLIWLLKALFLQEVVDRYYDWRLVTIDLIANFYKEQRSELIPGLVRTVNDFFASEASDHQIEPFTVEEVHAYYQNDKMIWDIFQSARRMDRYIKTRIFRKKYDFYLPEKIKR